MNKEIYKNKECTNKLLEAINELSDTVTLTMGPFGKTVIISDSNGNPYVTKDGVSVANYIHFEDPVKNIAVNLLKEVAQKTVDMAGDGTTTSICLANSFITKGYELMSSGYSYNDLKHELDELELYVVSHLKKGVKKLDFKKIREVATISANNDQAIGETIQWAYNNSKIVKVEESDKEKDELILLSGMRLDTGFFDKAFINNQSKQSIEYDKAAILVIDGHLTDLKNIAPTIEANREGLVIVADHFSDSVLSILRDNYNKGLLKIALIKSPGFATHRKDLMKDLALFTGGYVINPNNKETIRYGFIDSIKATSDKVLIVKKEIPEAAIRMASALDLSLSELNETQRELTKQRITNLSGNISIIKVGGKSELEMKERKDRIDDAVLAVSCALEEGIIEGAGKPLWLLSATAGSAFKDCLKAPYDTIVKNGSNSKLYEKDLFKCGVIDPYKVTRVAIQNAISIAKVILSTEAVVINNRLWR